MEKGTESMHHYVLAMQNIAARAELQETEVIDYIIDGFDIAQVNTLMLVGAQTLSQLKSLIIRYQDRYLNKPAVGSKLTSQTMTNRSKFAATTVTRSNVSVICAGRYTFRCT